MLLDMRKVAVGLLALALCQLAFADPIEEEITFLITSVADSGCVFVRNGDEHAAGDAAKHLRLKYRRGKRYVSSAENFIDRLASESSWSGEPYFITCPDGQSQPSKTWLSHRLMSYRENQSP